MGIRIICPVCDAEAPQRVMGEDIVWYGYRKWRWLANHLVTDHCRSGAISFQHRKAIQQKRARLSEIKLVKKTKAA